MCLHPYLRCVCIHRRRRRRITTTAATSSITSTRRYTLSPQWTAPLPAMPPLAPTPATLLLTHSTISTMAHRGLDLAFTPGDSDGRVDSTIGGSSWTAVSV
jgi:hypothetical protein